MSEIGIVAIITAIITAIPPTLAAILSWREAMRAVDKVNALHECVERRVRELMFEIRHGDLSIKSSQRFDPPRSASDD